MHVSPFERLIEPDERQRDAAEEIIDELFRGNPTILDNGSVCLLLDCVGNHLARDVYDYTHGLLTAGVDPEIDFAGDNVTEPQAFARLTESI